MSERSLPALPGLLLDVTCVHVLSIFKHLKQGGAQPLPAVCLEVSLDTLFTLDEAEDSNITTFFQEVDIQK